eukprot:scaffold237822_cov22-Prasinocladus_malaysianus.AAC.1
MGLMKAGKGPIQAIDIRRLAIVVGRKTFDLGSSHNFIGQVPNVTSCSARPLRSLRATVWTWDQLPASYICNMKCKIWDIGERLQPRPLPRLVLGSPLPDAALVWGLCGSWT